MAPGAVLVAPGAVLGARVSSSGILASLASSNCNVLCTCSRMLVRK